MCLQADHKWRNELNAAPALSLHDIQQREMWEEEEREALALIRAVYGEQALAPDAPASKASD